MEREQNDGRDDFYNQKPCKYRNTPEQMNQQQLFEYYQRIQANKSQNTQGKVEGQKYEHNYKMQPENEKSLQGLTNDQNGQTKKSLCQTRAQSQQHSQSQYSYYESQSNQSNQITQRNMSQNQSTHDHSANTSNFSYKSINRVGLHQPVGLILDQQQLNQSLQDSRSEQSISYSQIQKLSQQFHQICRQLGYQKSQTNLLRLSRSREQMRSMPDLFKEDRKIFFFTMDLLSQHGISLNQNFFDKLNKIDMSLLYKIDIGTQRKFKQLLRLFEINYQSLRKLYIERDFDDDDEDYKEHGFQFIKNINNQKRLVQIKWKSKKLTPSFAESFKTANLPSLKQFYFDLSEKITDQKAFGKLLEKIFQNIDETNHQNQFKIILSSSISVKQNLARMVKTYGKRIILKNKSQVLVCKSNEKSQKYLPQQVKPSISVQQHQSQTQLETPSYQNQLQTQVSPQKQQQPQLSSQQQQPQKQAQSQSQCNPSTSSGQASQGFSHINISSMLGGNISGISFGNNTYNR